MDDAHGQPGAAGVLPNSPSATASATASATTSAGPQRRFLTILFCDLSDSTRLAASMEAEDYAELLAALRGLHTEVIPRHGGMVTRIQGDGVLAIFGHPVAGEDDGRRAVEAALELHARVADVWPLHFRVSPRPPLAFHSGIHSGLVLIDDGDLIRGRVELIGDAPNVAARLSDLAGRGEILVSEGSLGPESSFFVSHADGPVRLPGRDEPVHVLRILGHASVATGYQARIQRDNLPFCGRDGELAWLQAALDEACAGRSQRLAVCAGPGMGKTRLVQRFIELTGSRDSRDSRDVRVVQSYCENYLGAQPLQPVRQWLWQLFDIQTEVAHGADPSPLLQRRLQRLAPALLDHLPALAQAVSQGNVALPLSLIPAGDGRLRPALGRSSAAVPDSGPRATVQALCAAVQALCVVLAQQRPLLIVVDDWQWVDDASRQVIDQLRQIDDLPLLLLLATRSQGQADARLSNTQVLQLGPLPSRDAASAVTALLPGVNPFMVANIVRYSGGNPLFIEELCHEATRTGTPHAQRPLEGSAWLDSLIEARIARLPPTLIDALRCAAVIGTVVPAWLLQSLTRLGPADPVWRQLAAEDLLYADEPGGRLRFKHGITRDVVYQGVGARERRALHRRAAEALHHHAGPAGADDICELLAYHHGAAGHAAEAARFAELAGDKALASSALDRAQAHYGAALQALDQLPACAAVDTRWTAIAQRLGLVCVFDPSRDQLATMQQAVARARAGDDLGALARAEYWLGYIAYAVGDAAAAIRHSERALGAAQQLNDQPLVVQIGATLGQSRAACGDYATALQLLDAAIATQRLGRRGKRPPVGIAYSLACKASVLADQGQFADAQTCFDEAVAAVQGAAHEVEGSVLCWRSGTLLWQGRWLEALDAADAARQIAQRVHSVYVYAMASSLAAYADWRLHGQAAAQVALTEATGWLDAGDRWLFVSLNQGWLADIAAHGGASDPAAAWPVVRRHTARALRRARQRDRLGSAMACRAMALTVAQASSGLMAGWARDSMHGLVHDSAHGSAHESARVWAHRLTGPPAAHYLAMAERMAATRGSAHERANNQWYRARIALLQGQATEARNWADQAATAFDRLDMAWHLAQVKPLLQVE